MTISFLKKRGTLVPSWRFTPEGIIWRIIVASDQHIVGEARNVQTKNVSFFCLDVATGRPLWQEATFGEQWWIGIEFAVAGTLFLHSYATPEMPVHKGIIAVDVLSGKQLWSNADAKFECAERDSVYSSRPTVFGIVFSQLDARTGTVVREISENDVVALRRNAADGLKVEVTEPMPIFDLAAEFSEEAIAIRAHCDIRSIVGPVEYIEHDTMVIFSFHERPTREENHTLNSKLKILSKKNGTVLFETTTNTNSSSAVPETFFTLGTRLLYIHERTTLAAIDVANLNRL